MGTATMLWILFLGCNDAAHQRVMHFFFEIPEDQAASQTDGSEPVPPVIRTASDTPGSGTAKADWVLHPPFQKGDCQACHVTESGMSFREKIMTGCRECHTHFFETTRRPHMPDLAEQCVTCHQPHRSLEAALLRQPERSLCWECHEEDEVMVTPAHVAAPTTACSVCHESHHSDRPHLLRSEGQGVVAQTTPDVEPGVKIGVEPEDFEDLRPAYFAQQASKLGISVAEAQAADAALSDQAFPFPADDAEAIAAGAATFVVQCSRCHGPKLEGNGPVKYKKANKASLVRENRRRGWDTDEAGKSADYFATITEGRLVTGEPSMPPFAEKLSRAQRWQLIIFVRSKQIEADK